MKLLYIIGNGLDIAHHMKTSYQDFFKYYLKLSAPDREVLKMKENIDSHRYEYWADLEMGLGSYSASCADKDVFLKCLTDIKIKLKEYLIKESEKIGQYVISSSSGFQNPGIFLDPEPRIRYYSFLRDYTAQTRIDVITLNYTTTLEALFGFKKREVPLSMDTNLHSITHLHGTLNSMMVMGVNDSSQIANSDYNQDLDVVEDFVKPEFNDACMNNKNAECEELIQDADVIVLYGTSLGPSDDKWWKLIGKRMELEEYPLLVYLPYDENKDQSAIPNRLRRWTMESVREIQAKFGVQLDEKVLAERICVAFNKRLLQIKKVEQQKILTK